MHIFSHSCCPSQGIFPPPAVQTLLPFPGNNWSVGWSCCPASLCYLSDVLGSGALEPLSIHIWRSLNHRLCIVFSVFDDDEGYKRGQTSRHVVGAEVQTNYNFEAHIYHCSYHLGFISCLFFIHFSWWLYNFAWLFRSHHIQRFLALTDIIRFRQKILFNNSRAN